MKISFRELFSVLIVSTIVIIGCASSPSDREVNVHLNKDQKGWCYLIYDTIIPDIDRSIEVHLDSNNCVKISRSFKGNCHYNIFDSAGKKITYEVRLASTTSFYEKIDCFKFYVLNDKEKKLPEETWTNSTDYETDLYLNCRKQIERLGHLYYK